MCLKMGGTHRGQRGRPAINFDYRGNWGSSLTARLGGLAGTRVRSHPEKEKGRGRREKVKKSSRRPQGEGLEILGKKEKSRRKEIDSDHLPT